MNVSIEWPPSLWILHENWPGMAHSTHGKLDPRHLSNIWSRTNDHYDDNTCIVALFLSLCTKKSFKHFTIIIMIIFLMCMCVSYYVFVNVTFLLHSKYSCNFLFFNEPFKSHSHDTHDTTHSFFLMVIMTDACIKWNKHYKLCTGFLCCK